MTASVFLLDNQLDQDQLGEVYESVFGAFNEWYNFGLSLGIGINQLKGIQSCCPDNQTRLREMLTHWLQTSQSCTWTDLYNALSSNTVQRMDVAGRIKHKCSGGILYRATLYF